MNIEYRNTKEFKKEQLADLFLSVEWASGKYPEKLVKAMKNYGTVFSAWDNDNLIGLISTMDDGIMTAYVHYLLVNPKYQGTGVGKRLVEITKEYYKDYNRIVLIAYDNGVEFYEKLGFHLGHGKKAMLIVNEE